MNVVTSKWVFKIKTYANGSIEQYKSHLVAQGFTQLRGLDYDERIVMLSSIVLYD